MSVKFSNTDFLDRPSLLELIATFLASFLTPATYIAFTKYKVEGE